ncbi:phage tail protein [Escherichia coli]|uniref:phage tail protein n=1 Tax=Escherichia coli TaxID=562 RepID=UPI0015D7E24B|nr:phage tail protein [Escherichia coli]EFP0881680.1 phage tail protein [Escherichia coli]NZC30488.1 phage tail protein [Escherichia coli]HCN6962445.1 phage tail protein [Escherichia coli]HCN7016194.1 phage tail protein [Escherichia coli]HCN7774891.1 phage tail protein [Escherichia coli]
MQRSWFNNRLTSAKQKSLLYKSLADLVQSMMDIFVDPWLERITNRKSIFSMNKEDLEIRTNELGQFFTIRTSNSSSVPMLLQQRFDEIHFKGTERPINQTIYREFNGISVLWDPVYAPIDQVRFPYGTVLIPESQLESTGDAYGDVFLTSRGMISIPINNLAIDNVTGGIDQSALTEDILKKFNQFVKPLLPLHIVFDGLMLYLSIMIYEREDILEYSTVVVSAATFFWFEANELAEIQGVTEESDAIAIAAGGIVVAGIHTFDRTRADDLLLDNDN